MRSVSTGRVLVADDSDTHRYVLGTWLRRAGNDVLEARSGAEALAILRDAPIDLVVLDVDLPDMSGYAVCEAIRRDAASAATAVLHVSASAIQPADRIEGLRRGADAYLVAPVEREVFLASVEALLRVAASQRTAMRLSERLRQLNDATLSVNRARTFEALLTTIVAEGYALFGTTTLVAARTGDRAMTARASASGVDVRATTSDAVAALAADARGHVATLDETDDARGFLIVERGVPIDDEVPIVLAQYARAVGTALRNLESSDVNRRIALYLQHNLLPAARHDIPGIATAVRYAAGGADVEVGGDFYEIFTVDDTRVAFTIGDVIGHSLEAATVMAQLRTGVRAYLLDGHGPTESLERLDRLLLRFHPEATATVICAILDRDTGRLAVANGGHPPALVVRADGPAYLPTGGVVLGVGFPQPPAYVTTLAPGDIVVFYTDGLIERVGEPIDVGFARLADAVGGRDQDLDALCDRLLRDVAPAEPTDDIAILAFRYSAKLPRRARR